MSERRIGPVEASIMRLKAMRVERNEQKNRAAKADRIEGLKADVAGAAAKAARKATNKKGKSHGKKKRAPAAARG